MSDKEKKWAELVKVHSDLKSKFVYKSDMELYGKSDFWTVMDDTYEGDCEDAALTLRRDLLALGWKPENVRIATCWTETGGYHAVLVAEIDGAAYVLDNRQNEVLPWEELPYKWDKIVSKYSDSWVEINA